MGGCLGRGRSRIGWVGSGTEPARPAVCHLAIQKMPEDERLRQSSGEQRETSRFHSL